MADLIPLEEFTGGQAGDLVPLEEFGGQVERRDPADYALRVMQAHGWSREQAAGIVGNLLHESNLNSGAVGDGGASYGLAQWNGARRKGLEAFAKARGTGADDFNTQLDYVHHELTNGERAAGAALKGAGDVAAATRIVSEQYERPGKPMLESRLAHAQRIYGMEPGDYLEAMAGLDVGPGLVPATPRPERIAGEAISAREPSLLERVADYLGYKDVPAFLPMYNRDKGEWERTELFEARRLYRGWEEDSEVQRVAVSWLLSPFPGVREMLESYSGIPMKAPETELGAVAGGAGELVGFVGGFPLKGAQLLLGSRLNPTRTGLRGVAQMMAQGGATLGLAHGISALVPDLVHNDSLSEAGYQFIKGTAASAVVGALFPVLGARSEGRIPNVLKLATGLAVLDFTRTRFQAAPDRGWFTGDDIIRGVRDGSIDRKVLAQKTFDYLLDLYFIGKTPTMKKSLEGLHINALVAEAAKANPQEAEDAILEIGRAGAPGTEKWRRMMEEEVARLAAEPGPGEEAPEKRTSPSPQPSPPEGRGGEKPAVELAGPEAAAAGAGVPPAPGETPAAVAAGEGVPAGVREFMQKYGTAKGGKPEGLLTGEELRLGISQVPTRDIEAAPEIFQYKLGAEEKTGAGLALEDVGKWDEGLSGVLTLWRSPEGKLFVVNGHQRLALAKRTGTPEVRAQVLDASEWSQQEARAYGARINIAEGRGTELDAAKFLRDTGLTAADLAAEGVSLSEAKTRRAVALSQLADPLFHETAVGRLSLERAVLIGEELAGREPAQEALLRYLKKAEDQGRELTNQKLRELIRLGQAAGQTSKKQQTLFGEEELTQSHLLEAADLAAYVKKNLARDKNLFGVVGDQAERLREAGNVIDPESNQAISREAAVSLDLFNKMAYYGDTATGRTLAQFAEQLAGGGNKAQIRKEAYAALKEALGEDGARFGLDAGGYVRPGQEEPEAARPDAAGREAGGGEPGAVPAPEISLTGGQKPPSPLEIRLNKLQEDYPGIDPDKAALVLRTFPDAGDGQIANMTADPEMYAQVVKGNLDAQIKAKLLEKAGDAEKQQRLLGAAPYMLFSGGPDTVAYGKRVLKLGGEIVGWFDKRLERGLPEELRNKDAGKNLGRLILKIQQFEDIGRTYLEAKPFFDAAREGLAVKMRFAHQFYALAAPYFTELNPQERARVDRLLVNLDQFNVPGGEEFRLRGMDSWRAYLAEPREEVRDKGIEWFRRQEIEFYSGEHLTEKEAAAAWGIRMALDYARDAKLEAHTRDFREWLGAHGFEAGKVNDILDLLMSAESGTKAIEARAEQVAQAYFGPDPSKKIIQQLAHYREVMDYWLKEQNQYVPRSRYGEYFLRVFDRSEATPLKRRAGEFLDALEAGFPGGLDAARDGRNWRGETGRLAVPPAVEQAYRALRWAFPKTQKAPWGEHLVDEALRLTNDLVYATAAESKAQFHEKWAELQERFPAAQGYEIKFKQEKQLPMELYAEEHIIPKMWRIMQEALQKPGMTIAAREAGMEAWQDFLAAKGAGAHYIRRQRQIIPGYETDLLRPLSDYLAGLAGYLGKMEKVRGFSQAMEQMPREMPNLMRHMNEYTNYLLSNPKEYELYRSLIYHWTLGGNLSFHFINSLQNLSTGWAVLGTVTNAPLKKLAAAGKDWAFYLATGEGLTGAEESALARARLEPELQPLGAAELSGGAYNPLYRWLHHDPTSRVNKALDVLKGFWQGSFVEQMNRESFFLAAFRATGDYDLSIAKTRQAHFLFGKESRMALARGAGTIPFIFLTYSTEYFTLMKNFTKAALGTNPEVYGTRGQGAAGLARMWAAAMVTGGLIATPLWVFVKAAYEKVFGSDPEQDAREFLSEDLGMSAGEAEFSTRMLYRGLFAAALGIDIGARIAPNLPFMNLRPDNLSVGALAEAALGAGAIPLARLVTAGKALDAGETGRAAEAMLPVSLANLAAGGRLAAGPATTLTGRPLFTAAGEPLQLTMGEAAWKALGFQPARLAERRAQEEFARRRERDKRARAQDYSGQLARAIRDSDDAAFNAVIGDWTEYNNRMLKAGRLADVIVPESVEAGIRSRFRPQYPDVSQKQMLLRRRKSAAEILAGGEETMP